MPSNLIKSSGTENNTIYYYPLSLLGTGHHHGDNKIFPKIIVFGRLTTALGNVCCWWSVFYSVVVLARIRILNMHT